MDEATMAEIEARANAATPGPWEVGVLRRECDHPTTNQFTEERSVFPPLGESGPVALAAEGEHENGAFIAHARTDVPALIAEVRRLTAALDAVTTEHAAAVARAESAESAFADVQVQWRAEMARLRAEHAAALDAARREGAEGMREVVKAEIRAAFHYNDPPADGVERPIGPIPGQWEAHQTLRKLLSRVCAVLTDGGAS